MSGHCHPLHKPPGAFCLTPAGVLQQVEDAYKTLDRDADGNLTVDDCRSL